MEFTTLGALVGLIIAIILIIKKVHPAYSLILSTRGSIRFSSLELCVPNIFSITLIFSSFPHPFDNKMSMGLRIIQRLL